jgi:anti-anti-sigma factor
MRHPSRIGRDPHPTQFSIAMPETMNIEAESLADGVWKINLVGRMDVLGTQAIDTKFSGMTAGERNAIVVDLSGVSFLASIGIRTLLLNGKAVGQRGGKMVLFKPEEGVAKVLRTAGIDTLLPIFDDLDAARSAVTKVQ